MNNVFGLDIGTRNVVGTVGYQTDDKEFVVTAQYVREHELTLDMVHFPSDQQTGVCNDLSILLLMFIGKLCDLHIFRV